MMCFIPDIRPEEAEGLMRWLGFIEHIGKTDGMKSFHRDIYEGHFPRFHAGIAVMTGGAKINLHLDQANNDGLGNHKYVWAYASPLVRTEIDRIEAKSVEWKQLGRPIPLPPKAKTTARKQFRSLIGRAKTMYETVRSRAASRQRPKSDAPTRLR